METEIKEDLYKVRTGNFEGPLGLLLNLVEEHKLMINEVSLAQVTEDYINYIKSLGGASTPQASSFIVVAATLILIKSKSLLPNLDLTSGEEKDIHDLEERLRLYKLFTELSGNIKSTFGKKMIFAPLERKISTLVFLPDAQITKDSMMTLAQDVLGAMPKKVFLPKIEVKKIISIEEMIDKLTDRIKDTFKMSFKDFTGKSETKEGRMVMIVGFLAMLELVRNGILHATQENLHDDIIIEKREALAE